MSREAEFNEAMLTIYKRARTECRYTPTRFLQMVSEQGGLQAARSLLASAQVSEGFTTLWEKRRLDLSLEALVLRQEWRDLFSDEERAIARQRLATVGYGVE
jgi:hypothetical protein